MTDETRTNAPAMRASGLVLAAVLFLVAAVYSSFTIIQPGNVGVVFNRWSGALKTVGQGVAWRVPWVTQVQSYPVALRTYTMVQRGEEGAMNGDDSIDLPTKEGQHIRQDISVTYNTSQEKAADVFRSFTPSTSITTPVPISSAPKSTFKLAASACARPVALFVARSKMPPRSARNASRTTA